jgi:Fe2+ or Zn2+ uptake regulation protein
MAQILEDLKSTLRAKGIRITVKRNLILQVLHEAGTHLDADSIFERARQVDPHLSLTTVYRTLQLLKEAGYVDEHYISREYSRDVDDVPGMPDSYRFSCVRCGHTVEFPAPLLDRARWQLVKEHNIHILHGCLTFEGYCVTCLPRAISH